MKIADSSTIEYKDIQDLVIKLSNKPENKGMYCVCYTDFNEVHMSTSHYLGVYSPSDSDFTWYVLNGKVRYFTDKQRIADQNATPTML